MEASPPGIGSESVGVDVGVSMVAGASVGFMVIPGLVAPGFMEGDPVGGNVGCGTPI